MNMWAAGQWKQTGMNAVTSQDLNPDNGEYPTTNYIHQFIV